MSSTLRPTFLPGFTDLRLYEMLLRDAQWVNVQNSPRNECFMALDTSLTYTYGSQARGRTYEASLMHPSVVELMEDINRRLDTRFNVCVLNHYSDQHQWLGWHSDDSPEQDPNHPIAVVSFGAEREIWVRPVGAKGHTPPEDRFLFTEGSLFVMPAGFQDSHQHKIPKHPSPCSGRVSLTFRNLLH